MLPMAEASARLHSFVQKAENHLRCFSEQRNWLHGVRNETEEWAATQVEATAPCSTCESYMPIGALYNHQQSCRLRARGLNPAKFDPPADSSFYYTEAPGVVCIPSPCPSVPQDKDIRREEKSSKAFSITDLPLCIQQQLEAVAVDIDTIVTSSADHSREPAASKEEVSEKPEDCKVLATRLVACSMGDGDELVDESSLGTCHVQGAGDRRLCPSQLWLVQQQTDRWQAIPGGVSTAVHCTVRHASCVPVRKARWLLAFSLAKHGIVVSEEALAALLVLWGLCVKAMVRESCGAPALAMTSALEDGLVDESVPCTDLGVSLGWFSSMLVEVVEEKVAVQASVEALRQLLLVAGRHAVVAYSGDDEEWRRNKKHGQVENKVQAAQGGGHLCLLGKTYHHQEVEAAVQGWRKFVEEEKWVQLYERDLDEPPASLEERRKSHSEATAFAERERASRPQYQPVSQHDSLRWKANAQDSKGKSALERMAEERDYRRRRMSYRGKKVKRSITQVFRDLIDKYMADLAASANEGQEQLADSGNRDGSDRATTAGAGSGAMTEEEGVQRWQGEWLGASWHRGESEQARHFGARGSPPLNSYSSRREDARESYTRERRRRGESDEQAPQRHRHGVELSSRAGSEQQQGEGRQRSRQYGDGDYDDEMDNSRGGEGSCYGRERHGKRREEERRGDDGGRWLGDLVGSADGREEHRELEEDGRSRRDRKRERKRDHEKSRERERERDRRKHRVVVDDHDDENRREGEGKGSRIRDGEDRREDDRVGLPGQEEASRVKGRHKASGGASLPPDSRRQGGREPRMEGEKEQGELSESPEEDSEGGHFLEDMYDRRKSYRHPARAAQFGHVPVAGVDRWQHDSHRHGHRNTRSSGNDDKHHDDNDAASGRNGVFSGSERRGAAGVNHGLHGHRIIHHNSSRRGAGEDIARDYHKGHERHHAGDDRWTGDGSDYWHADANINKSVRKLSKSTHERHSRGQSDQEVWDQGRWLSGEQDRK